VVRFSYILVQPLDQIIYEPVFKTLYCRCGRHNNWAHPAHIHGHRTLQCHYLRLKYLARVPDITLAALAVGERLRIGTHVHASAIVLARVVCARNDTGTHDGGVARVGKRLGVAVIAL